MAVKQRGSATKADGQVSGSSMSADVIAAVGDIVAASHAAAAHVPKATRRRIERLGRQLDAARATEAKRLRQAARLRDELAKRERQAADAAALMASIVVSIREAASGVSGAQTGPTPGRRATATKASARKAAAKPASASKPAAAKATAAKPAGAARPATAAKAPTRRRSTTKPRPKPATPRRAASSRTTKPKPTA
jgi:hypothetical protein